MASLSWPVPLVGSFEMVAHRGDIYACFSILLIDPTYQLRRHIDDTMDANFQIDESERRAPKEGRGHQTI